MALLIFFSLLLLVALPLNEISRITIGLHVSFTLLDVLVGIIAVVWLLRQVWQRKYMVSSQAKLFTATIAVFTLSLVANMYRLSFTQTLTAALYIVRWMCYGSIFFMVLSNNFVKKKMPALLFACGILLVCIGYIQYFFYPALRNLFYAGWDEDYYRMFATFFDPNFFGLFLSLFFLFVVSQFASGQTKKNRVRVLLYSMLTVATFFAILLTYSRTALVTVAIGILVLFWQKKLKKFIVPLFIGAAFLVILIFTLGNTRTKVNSLFRVTSSDARIGSAKNALIIFLDNPLFGVGFNAYRYAQYRHHFMPGSTIQEDHGASGSDVSMLFVLATSGIVGSIVFCIFLYSHFKKVLQAKNRLGLATFVAWMVGSLFINGLFYPSILVWVWIIFGLTESDAR